jgi:hypothetical protein
MPTYTFYSHDTDEVFELSMRMSERENYIKNNNVTQIPTPIALHSGRGMTKPDEGFRDILREMKKKNSKGLYRSTINTF